MYTCPFSKSSRAYRNKKVINSIWMWDPSTSASVRMITLPYLSLSMLAPLLLPSPTARIRLDSSWFFSSVASSVFSMFRIFPLSGSTA